MADLKPISQFNAASAVDANTLFLVSTPNGANYDSENASAALVADAVVNDFEYTQDLSTVDKTISGGINENKSVIGYSYDAYDATMAYSTGDLCIYNNTLYKAKQATTGNLPTNTTYWEPTSIATALSGKANKAVSMIDGTYLVTVGSNKLLKIIEDDMTICASGYFQANQNISANGNICNVGKNLKTSMYFTGYIGSTIIPMVLTDNGNIYATVAISNGQWVNFSCIGYKA